MRKRRKKYIVEDLIDNTVKPRDFDSDKISGPSPDEGLIYRNKDLCWYPASRNMKSNKSEQDKLESLL